MDPRDDEELDRREYRLHFDLPVDGGCPLRFPEDRGRELRLIQAVRYGEAGSVDELRHF